VSDKRLPDASFGLASNAVAPQHATVRRVMIHDQADRDAVSSHLLRYRDGHGDDWADIIDLLTLNPEARRKVVRVLGEIAATS
jgi:hypothetical protein